MPRQATVSWLLEVRVELENIAESDLIEPHLEVNPEEDHVVGEISLELKKLFTFGNWSPIRTSITQSHEHRSSAKA
jgi:hypothetical protein